MNERRGDLPVPRAQHVQRSTGWEWAAGERRPPTKRMDEPHPDELHEALLGFEERPFAIVMGRWQWKKLHAWRREKPAHFVATAGDPELFDRVPVVLRGKYLAPVICKTFEELEEVVQARD